MHKQVNQVLLFSFLCKNTGGFSSLTIKCVYFTSLQTILKKHLFGVLDNLLTLEANDFYIYTPK